MSWGRLLGAAYRASRGHQRGAGNLDNDPALSGNHYFLSILRIDSGLTKSLQSKRGRYCRGVTSNAVRDWSEKLS